RGGERGQLWVLFCSSSYREPVWVGHYRQGHREMSAAEAVAEFLGSEVREGWEVLVPRRIAANEIHRVRSLPQVVGWRFFPGAKGKPPFCTCEYCIKGQYGAERLRQRREEQP